jgi:hypothetical protein
MVPRSLLLLALVVPLVGCAKDGVGPVVPVSGKVTVDGKPIPLGTVSFRPMAEKGNTSRQEPGGEIEEDGTYTLYTAGKEGAPAGWWKVIVSARDPIDPKDPYKPTKSYVPDRYELLNKTDLQVEVAASSSPGAYDLKMKTK